MGRMGASLFTFHFIISTESWSIGVFSLIVLLFYGSLRLKFDLELMFRIEFRMILNKILNTNFKYHFKRSDQDFSLFTLHSSLSTLHSTSHFSLLTFHFTSALAFGVGRLYLAAKKEMLNWLKRKLGRKEVTQGEVQPLCIEGTRTTLTPQPDEAEIAAKALLEQFASEKGKVKREKSADTSTERDEERGPAYYRRLAERIREGRTTEARLVMRYLAYCEQELQNPLLPPGQVADLEKELYRRLDIIDREGGELKRRWQHCLAEVTVRLMNAPENKDAPTEQKSDKLTQIKQISS